MHALPSPWRCLSGMLDSGNKDLLPKNGKFWKHLHRRSTSQYDISSAVSLNGKDTLLTRKSPNLSIPDGRNKEPVTLPAKNPVLLALGAEGLCRNGHKILPHNLIEVLKQKLRAFRMNSFFFSVSQRGMPMFPSIMTGTEKFLSGPN